MITLSDYPELLAEDGTPIPLVKLESVQGDPTCHEGTSDIKLPDGRVYIANFHWELGASGRIVIEWFNPFTYLPDNRAWLVLEEERDANGRFVWGRCIRDGVIATFGDHLT